MAEDPKAKAPQSPAPAAAADDAPPERELAFNETIPGGRYMQDGRLVNAMGEPIDAQGNVKK